jgi:predicted SprT family Zn-dependent metalloprotease
MTNSSAGSNRFQTRKANKLSTDLLADGVNTRASGWLRQWRVPTLLQKISLRRNDLLRATIARWRQKTKCIELGPQFFRLTKRQDAILCHELAHAAAIQIYGNGVAPHGPEWHALVKAAGFSPSPSIKASKARSAGVHKTASISYEHRCPVCHAVRYAKRQIRQWRCGECSQHGLAGLLTVTKMEGRR